MTIGIAFLCLKATKETHSVTYLLSLRFTLTLAKYEEREGRRRKGEAKGILQHPGAPAEAQPS